MTDKKAMERQSDQPRYSKLETIVDQAVDGTSVMTKFGPTKELNY
jgi:hypothetical protein